MAHLKNVNHMSVAGVRNRISINVGLGFPFLCLQLFLRPELTDANGPGPSGHQSGDGLADDRLPEDGAAEDVPDGAVGREPHLLQTELDDALLVGGDGGALDGDVVLQRGESRVDGDLLEK